VKKIAKTIATTINSHNQHQKFYYIFYLLFSRNRLKRNFAKKLRWKP